MLCVSVLYVSIGVRLLRTYVLQHILFFKSNVLLQTPDPRAGVHLFTGVTRSARSRTSRSQLELQHKIQTLDEIPELSTHQLASLTYWRQAPPTIRSCWLQPKLHRGNICYIFHNIFLFFIGCHIGIQAAVLFLYNDNIQAPEVPSPAQSNQWPCDGCNYGVVSHLLSENCRFLLNT